MPSFHLAPALCLVMSRILLFRLRLLLASLLGFSAADNSMTRFHPYSCVCIWVSFGECVCVCVCEYIYAQGSTTNISQLNPKRATNKATSSKATQPLQWMNEQAEVTECGWVAEWVPAVSRWVSVWINDWLDDWAAAVHIIWLQDRQGCQRQSSPAATGQQQRD